MPKVKIEHIPIIDLLNILKTQLSSGCEYIDLIAYNTPEHPNRLEIQPIRVDSSEIDLNNNVI